MNCEHCGNEVKRDRRGKLYHASIAAGVYCGVWKAPKTVAKPAFTPTGRKRRHTKEELAAIIETLKAHPEKNYQEIAVMHNSTWGAVGSIANRNGLAHGRSGPRRFARVPESRRMKRQANEAKILDYVKAHPELTYDEIADYFGVAHQTVNGLVYRSGYRRTAVTPEAKAKQAEIAEYIKAHPEMSYSDMGRALDLPTLRVANIARKFGMMRGKGQGPRHNNGRAGYTRTFEERQRLSEYMTELWANMPQSHRDRLSRIMKGNWTEERKQKFGQAVKKMWKEAKAGE